MIVFISQPMSGLSEEEITITRERVIDRIIKKYGHDVTIMNSYYNDDYRKATEEDMGDALKHPPLYWLSQALESLAECDVIWMCDGWEESKGCFIEMQCAQFYDIDTEFDNDYKQED